MPTWTLYVNTIGPGQATDRTGEESEAQRGTLKPPDQPDRDLARKTKHSLHWPRRLWRRRTDDIPPGMEGFYYLP